MIEPTYTTLIIIYYTALFIGLLTLLFMFACTVIYLLDKLAKRYKFIWMIVEYYYYKEEFKEFFKDQKSVTGKFNKK